MHNHYDPAGAVAPAPPPPWASGQGDGPRNPQGGQPSNSPPSKVKTTHHNTPQPLLSGIDTLYLSVDLEWASPDFFVYLTKLKEKAIEQEEPLPGTMGEWLFNLQPFGRRGYEWLLIGPDYSFAIGDWLKPKSRPSVVIEIRSETLWYRGAQNAVDFALTNLQAVSGFDLSHPTIKSVKVSRVDLCADLVFPEVLWSPALVNSIVCRARGFTHHQTVKTYTGFAVGTGNIKARLYDKAYEVLHKSKKFWMFDLWKLPAVPVGMRIIRVEFQMNREAVKELGIDDQDDLFTLSPNLWAYCTQDWLKFQDRPGTHHTQRSTLPWWIVVQHAYHGAQGAEPLIRSRVFNQKMDQFYRQSVGLLSSVAAIHAERNDLPQDYDADLNLCQEAFFEASGLANDTAPKFAETVRKKRARYHRSRSKAEAAFRQRLELGFKNMENDNHNQQGDNHDGND